jgi:hypothetical protein
MPSDRAQFSSLTWEAVGAVITDALLPNHFFAAPAMSLEWEHLLTEEIPWEIFQGRLLERAHTRQMRTFEAWNIYSSEGGTRSSEPLLALKLDLAAGEVHVVRGLLCYVWEGYHAGDNVYLSRETTRWVRELVGTFRLADLRDAEELRAEVTGRLFAAVVGLSRLPLTSVEAPLPAFALGQLAYFSGREARGDAGPMHSWRDLLAGALTTERSASETARLLEVLLRATPAEELGEVATQLVQRWREVGHTESELPRLLRAVFNDISLSPWTDFVAKALAFVCRLVESQHLSLADRVDFLGHLLRQTGRHLTAYDLVTFHHRGANYPDALLLDLVLKEYLALVERHPELFTAEDERGRLRRRALRQGWLLRQHYEGLLVPDAPTSPGENARLLPAPHRRVPDEQILQVMKRTRRLYDADPLPRHVGEAARQVLAQSFKDLRHPEELRELGTAVFIDRPLGVFKSPAAPDQTPLLSYEAFSKTVAARRLTELARLDSGGLPADEVETLRKTLEALTVPGLPLSAVGEEVRPVVSLADARKVSDDFVLLRTLPRGLRELLAHYPSLYEVRPLLVFRGVPRPGESALLAVYDAELRKRMELEIDARQGYVTRGGVELPAGGLRLLRVWES